MIVGLTGGIGSGKSAVSTQLQTLGITVVNADQVAREVVVPGSFALTQIAKHFGSDVLQDNGSLHRSALRRLIFTDQAEKQWLEALLHPIMDTAIDMQLAAANNSNSVYVVLESPLLLETRQHEKTDFVVVVDTTQTLQRQRASCRDDNSMAQIDAIIASQMPRQKRLEKAQWVLDNQSDLPHLTKQVLQLHQHLIHMVEG
ncbi:MAG: dephospho-CoA kinase [Gammaproteobacteria bacterium]|nr:dephospho-CoA kinase [Gammaproteobacteria bacterium]